MAFLTLEINLICYPNLLEFYSAIASPTFNLGHWQAECPLVTASVRLVFVKNPVMENTQTPAFNKSATKALAGYGYTTEILTSCHTELLRSIQSYESTKETAELMTVHSQCALLGARKTLQLFFPQ